MSQYTESLIDMMMTKAAGEGSLARFQRVYSQAKAGIDALPTAGDHASLRGGNPPAGFDNVRGGKGRRADGR